jgi:hypothetical protein
MRALKTVVVVLGALIIAAFGLLVYGLSQNWQRATRPAATAAPSPAATPGLATGAPAAVKTWGRASLGLPADSHIQSVTPAGHLVVVHVVAGSDERLVVLDPATGTVVGTFGVAGQP